jgi:hypothetical protein
MRLSSFKTFKKRQKPEAAESKPDAYFFFTTCLIRLVIARIVATQVSIVFLSESATRVRDPIRGCIGPGGGGGGGFMCSIWQIIKAIARSCISKNASSARTTASSKASSFSPHGPSGSPVRSPLKDCS